MTSTSESSLQTPQLLLSDCSQGFLQKLSGLFGSHDMSDITLVVGTKEFPAHRLLLCLFSDVFKVMLLNKEWNEAQEKKVVLQETPQCCDHFDKFLAFFYKGKISLAINECLPILCLADKYNVKELISSCLEYMSSHIAFAAAQNILLSWLQYTHYCGHATAAQACQNFVLWNFSAVAVASDFGFLELESLVWILQQNDVVIEDEMEMFKLVVSWLDLQRQRLTAEPDFENTMANYTRTAMLCVRFPMMSPRKLADLLLSPLVTKYKDFFLDRLALGMAFHRNDKARLTALMDEDPLMLTPRIYTADIWSSVLTIERFSYVQAYHTSTLVFSIPSSYAECRQSNQIEWVVDFYPRGLRYHKGLLIGWEGTKEVPEAVLRTCRLSLTCRDLEHLDKRFVHVKIGILVCGTNAGIEHIASVMYKQHYFDLSNSVLHLDDILPYEKLVHSKFLVGDNKDTLKIRIVIEPLVDLDK